METTQITLKFAQDAWSAVIHSPAWMIVGMVLMVIAFCIQKSQSIDNKWIPIVYVVGGLILLPLLGDRKSIPSEQSNPTLMMMALGTILGFMTYVAHFGVYKYLGKRIPQGFFPPDEPERNDNQNDKPPTQ